MWINVLDLCFHEFASGGQCTRKSTEIIQPLLRRAESVCVSTCLGENGEVMGQWRMMHFSLILRYSARVRVCVFRLVYFDTLIRLFRRQFIFKLGKCRFNYNCLKYRATFPPPPPFYPVSSCSRSVSWHKVGHPSVPRKGGRPVPAHRWKKTWTCDAPLPFQITMSPCVTMLSILRQPLL